MTGHVVICSGEWEYLAGYGGQLFPVCTGTIQSMPVTELNPSGLSLEDWREYTWDVVGLFAMVFGFLALKKALTQ